MVFEESDEKLFQMEIADLSNLSTVCDVIRISFETLDEKYEITVLFVSQENQEILELAHILNLCLVI